MQTITLYFAGIALGLGLIGPIGPINLFLIRQGLVRGWRGSVTSVALVGVNDTLMIGIGAVAAITAADKVAALRLPLTIGGALYLTFLAISIARSKGEGFTSGEPLPCSFRHTAALCMGVVWLNPHALIDIFGVLGNAISVQPDERRLTFALGVVTASWIWYIALASGASLFRSRMTASAMSWVNRGSAAILGLFATIFWIHILTW